MKGELAGRLLIPQRGASHSPTVLDDEYPNLATQSSTILTPSFSCCFSHMQVHCLSLSSMEAWRRR